MTLNELTINDKELFEKYIDNNHENCEASFGNLFIWRNIVNTKYTIIDDALCVIYKKNDGRFASCYPFGSFDEKQVFKKLNDFFEANNQKMILESVTNKNVINLAKLYNHDIEILPQRDLFDYVYTSDSLISLSGKKLHSKRNHINKFLSLYPDYIYKELNKSMFDECISYVDNWLLQKYSPDDDDYKTELKVIKECFENYDKLDFYGGALYVNGKLCAFTIGEKYYKNSFVVHIEKADVSIEGAYTMINNLFVKNIKQKWNNIEYINREEDMGIEGIRKAKLSYKPHHMVEKSTVIFK